MVFIIADPKNREKTHVFLQVTNTGQVYAIRQARFAFRFAALPRFATFPCVVTGELGCGWCVVDFKEGARRGAAPAVKKVLVLNKQTFLFGSLQ